MNLTKVIQYLKDRHIDEQIELCPGVSEELIKQVEQTYNLKLPDDIKQFYRFTNGFDTSKFLFNLISMENMISGRIDFQMERLPIAEYMIYSDTWYLEIHPENHNIYYITVAETQGKGILTRSLATFIEYFIAGGLSEEGGVLS